MFEFYGQLEILSLNGFDFKKQLFCISNLITIKKINEINFLDNLVKKNKLTDYFENG